MVSEINSFIEKFRDYSDCYTIIGGAACDVLLTEAELPFRATRDIDMILIIEDAERYQDFGRKFWEYIKEGNYKCGWKNSESMHFYRFTNPKPGYPVQIELFSRRPGYNLNIEEGIIPVHIDDDTSSLSAILLDDDFYNFMKDGRSIIDGMSVLREAYLIPFKMYAWLDLSNRKARGEHINDKDLKKHKYDVFRLLQIVSPAMRVKNTGNVRIAIQTFLERIQNENIPFANLGLEFSKDDAINVLREIYNISQ